MMLRVANEKPAGFLADPLDKANVVGAAEERFDAVEGIGSAAAGAAGFGRLSPFVDEGLGEAQFRGDLLHVAFVKNFAEQFMGVHSDHF